MPTTQAVRWLGPLAVLIVGNFMAVLDVTIVNVAVPSIQKDFGGALKDVLWIATAYTLMLGVVVPLSSWLSDKLGLRTTYAASLALFAATSGLCGIAWDLNTLIAFRVLQAIPGGIMPVVTMTLVYRIVPREKIGAAMGLFGLGVIFAPAVGPVLGGYLVEYFNWRLVFFVNLPVGVLGAIATVFVIPKIAPAAPRRFDVLGFLTVALGLAAILLACEEGQDWGWTGYRVLMLLTFGVLSLALFVVVELHVAQPLLNLRVLANRSFTTAQVILAVIMINLLGLSFYLPVFLQQGQGKEAFDAGLLLLPQAIAMGLVAPISGRLYDRIGPRPLATVGLLVAGYGTYLLCNITPDMTRENLIFWSCVRGLGLGLSMMPVITAGLSAVSPDQTNNASAINNVIRQVAGALGLAGLNALASQLQAQLMVDRAPLMPRDVLRAPPTSPEGFAQAYGMYRYLSTSVLATSYSNLFLLIALATGACTLLALTLRRQSAGQPTAPARTAEQPERALAAVAH